jgi:hypothetical protein
LNKGFINSSTSEYKGSMGRIAIVGGSAEYTGSSILLFYRQKTARFFDTSDCQTHNRFCMCLCVM